MTSKFLYFSVIVICCILKQGIKYETLQPDHNSASDYKFTMAKGSFTKYVREKSEFLTRPSSIVRERTNSSTPPTYENHIFQIFLYFEKFLILYVNLPHLTHSLPKKQKTNVSCLMIFCQNHFV